MSVASAKVILTGMEGMPKDWMRLTVSPIDEKGYPSGQASTLCFWQPSEPDKLRLGETYELSLG